MPTGISTRATRWGLESQAIQKARSSHNNLLKDLRRRRQREGWEPPLAITVICETTVEESGPARGKEGTALHPQKMAATKMSRI